MITDPNNYETLDVLDSLVKGMKMLELTDTLGTDFRFMHLDMKDDRFKRHKNSYCDFCTKWIPKSGAILLPSRYGKCCPKCGDERLRKMKNCPDSGEEILKFGYWIKRDEKYYLCGKEEAYAIME